jgi:hypothetical protein
MTQAPTGTEAELGSAFTYQGYLASDDTPVNGRCDFEFSLYDALSDGRPVGDPVTRTGVSVLDGYFTVQLDFGDVFDGTALWLAIAVKCRDDAFYIPLEPRQELTAAPYALTAQTAQTADSALSADSALLADSALTLEPGAVISGSAGHILKAENSYDGGGVTTALAGGAKATTGYHYGVVGGTDSNQGVGVYGIANATDGLVYGVAGKTSSPGGYGVFGWSTTWDGLAGKFNGNVDVNGTLTKNAGSFKIDHPLDPANKYLSHSFVESPDMLNIYNGNVILDEDGTAWVALPEWFEALNGGEEHRSEYRYQLTCIGGFAPVYIAQKIEHNRFQIAGGTPGLEVSWQVTGIRHDPYAEAHRIPVEEDKPADELGTYRHPELYGQPEELGVDYQRLPPHEIGAEE